MAEGNQEKLKALQMTMERLDKAYGKGTVMRLGDDLSQDIEVKVAKEIKSSKIPAVVMGKIYKNGKMDFFSSGLSRWDRNDTINENNMPIDIQVLINDGEIGLAMLRIIEIIGEDELKNLGSETLYFLVNALNQMDIDLIRNEILSAILPVRV